jgi:hypothetical protein
MSQELRNLDDFDIEPNLFECWVAFYYRTTKSLTINQHVEPFYPRTHSMKRPIIHSTSKLAMKI